MNFDRVLRPDYRAHAILDPDYLQKDEEGARSLYKAFFEMKRGPDSYNQQLNHLIRPWNDPRPLPENLAMIHSYLREVDLYVRELLRLVPPEPAEALTPLRTITETNDFLELMQVAFLGSDRRERFEAQRKLYLAKLFFDVDHTTDVQNGPFHAKVLQECLEKELWSNVTRVRPVSISYSIAPDGEKIDYSIGHAAEGQETWHVNLRRLRRNVGGKPTIVHVFYSSCRFKRQYILRHPGSSASDENAVEEKIWAELQRGRSGSIVSKMVRKGEADPHKIGDLIGAMFIVKDVKEVGDLQSMLYDIFGGPMRWREEVDTIRNRDDRTRLNEFSASGYEVKKSLVGVLCQPPDADRPPYLFNVEFQIYTLEGFLKTVHSKHYASHEQLKLRQFLEGLLPYLFPASVYGAESILACFPAGDHT